MENKIKGIAFGFAPTAYSRLLISLTVDVDEKRYTFDHGPYTANMRNKTFCIFNTIDQKAGISKRCRDRYYKESKRGV